MKAGDTVQIRQADVVPEGAVARPPVPQGRIDHWIYAEVIEPATAAGPNVRVKVNHRGNRVHGQTLVVPPADVRTKADVERLAAKASDPAMKKHFATQAKRLTAQAAEPSQ